MNFTTFLTESFSPYQLKKRVFKSKYVYEIVTKEDISYKFVAKSHDLHYDCALTYTNGDMIKDDFLNVQRMIATITDIIISLYVDGAVEIHFYLDNNKSHTLLFESIFKKETKHYYRISEKDDKMIILRKI